VSREHRLEESIEEASRREHSEMSTEEGEYRCKVGQNNHRDRHKKGDKRRHRGRGVEMRAHCRVEHGRGGQSGKHRGDREGISGESRAGSEERSRKICREMSRGGIKEGCRTEALKRAQREAQRGAQRRQWGGACAKLKGDIID
jgi:hypothetical protein